MSSAKNISKNKVVDAATFSGLNADEKGYALLADYLKTHTGIHMPINPKNLTLMAARLSKVMANGELKNYKSVHAKLQAGDAELHRIFVEALTTNRTEFFRENNHFAILSEILPAIIKKKMASSGGKELRIWCAAASRGHEVYSILITLLEAGLNPTHCRLRFLASDIDRSVLEAASRGVYLEDELQAVTDEMLTKYFSPIKSEAAKKRYKVKDELRELITFANFNLVEFPYHFQHNFDIIFCRNVMIYFDSATIIEVKNQLAKVLAVEGYLFIGHSETGSGKIAHLRTIDNAFFQKVEEGS